MAKGMKIVMIPSPVVNPITGGEIYEAKLLEFLGRKFGKIESIKIDTLQLQIGVNKSIYEMIFIGTRSLIRNLLYVLRFVKNHDNQKTVVLEDAYYSTDLFFFNFLIRRIRKNLLILPIVHHLYYPFQKQKSLQVLLKAIEIWFLRESNWIIANSEATQNHVKELLKENKEILIAYPGLDPEKMAHGNTEYSKLDSDQRLKVLAVGSVTERKDLETLLKATEIIVNRYGGPSFSVYVVGDLEKDKEFSARILEKVDAMSLSDHIIFTGRINNTKLRDFYERSDIFVSTSLHEGFGMAVVEAMSNCMPVVATKCGVLPHLVEDGVNGFLVKPRDYEQLAEKITFLLKSEELRKKMGAKGLSKAKKFDWNVTFNRICEKLLEA